MLSMLLALAPLAQAGSFGGGFAGFGLELDNPDFDGDSVEPLLVLDIRPYVTENGKVEFTWVPVTYQYSILYRGEIADRLQVAAFEGVTTFEGGTVGANFRVGEVTWENDRGTLDLEFGQGDLRVDILEENLQLLVGGDVRLRWVFQPDVEDEFIVGIGIPLGVRARTPREIRPYAEGELVVRPSVALLGDRAFVIDSRLDVGGGYAIVEGQDLKVRAGLGYSLDLDNFTARGLDLVNTFTVGVSIVF